MELEQPNDGVNAIGLRMQRERRIYFKNEFYCNRIPFHGRHSKNEFNKIIDMW